MIHARRVAHRRIFGALAVLLPAVWAAGLALRPELPPIGPVEEKLLEEAGFASIPADPRLVESQEMRFQVSVEIDEGGDRLFAIRPVGVVLRPDLLVYWTPPGTPSLEGGAVLMGSLSGTSPRRLRLPGAVGQGRGDVVIFSLGHGEIVARFPLSAALADAGS